MAGQFDKVARALASDMPRRKVLRVMAGGVTATFAAAVLGRNAGAEDGLLCGPGHVNYTPNYAPCEPPGVINTGTPDINQGPPEVNQGPPSKVVTITVPYVNQAGVPYLPGIVEDLLPDIPGVNWNVVPVPVAPSGSGSGPDVNQSTPPAPPIVVEVPEDYPDIGEIIKERLKGSRSLNLDVVPHIRSDSGR